MILDTGDTRETAAAFVMKDLIDERAELAVYDPQVIPLPVHFVLFIFLLLLSSLLLLFLIF